MRASITAILVIRQGGEQLAESLKALTTQSRPVDSLVLVDSSADSTLGPTLDSALADAPFAWSVTSVPYTARFSEAVQEGMAAAFGEGKPGVLLLPVLVIIALGTVGTAVYRTVWIARRLPLIDPDDG